ncbi:MAG TPA: condensation domain-containing protein, partial [Pyrinomonadaceae bacterium]
MSERLAPASQPSTLVELLRQRARQRPDGRAYVFLPDEGGEETCLTYAGLDRRARAIAAALAERGAGGGRALLLYPPGLDFVEAFFGCLYAGVVAVPAYPPRQSRHQLRLRSIADDARASLALTTSKALSRPGAQGQAAWSREGLSWLATDGVEDDRADAWREPAVGGKTVAFLQYTSGSTSDPKGVVVTHGNVLGNERMIQEAFGQSEQSVIVGWLPLYHDMGLIGNVLQPLYVGAPSILMSPAAFLQKPFRWLEAISRYRATTSGGPNFAYDLCASKVTPEQRASLDLSSWKVAFNGAEPVRHETLERFAEAFEPCGFRRESFYPCYGLAEATLFVSGNSAGAGRIAAAFRRRPLEAGLATPAHTEDEDTRTLVSCGRTLGGTRAVVVAPDTLEECADGRVGEVWVAGPSVAEGYWNRPAQTEETFGARLARTGEGPFLRTGDLGFRHEGSLYVTGRLKELLIIRGGNHYPQDIELTAERSHAALRPGSGAAFSVEVRGEERLVVVQEVQRGRFREAEEAAAAVRGNVAEEHEVPVHAVVLVKPGGVPKTSSGKIQRAACRAKFLGGDLEVVAEWRASAAAETNATAAPDAHAFPLESPEAVAELLVAQLAAWLGVGPAEIDPRQPLSRYNLDSLTALEVVHALEAGAGVSLPVVSLLQSQSVSEVAARVYAEAAGRRSAPRPGAREGARHPLSYGQRALWFLHRLAPESAAYNVPVAARIPAELNVGALRRAFRLLVERHAALRTTFDDATGEPLQRVHERAEVSFEQRDASALSDAELNDALAAEAHRPFDLEQGPPLRVTLFTRTRGEHVLLLVAHHIVVDLWSMGVLVRELGLAYRAESSGEGLRLPPLALQYTDYARWQAETLAGAEGERLEAFWRKSLEDPPPVLDLPTDLPRPQAQSFRGASESVKLDLPLSERLKALGRSHDATLYVTLLAAFEALLYRHTGQGSFVVGSPVAGRGRAEWAPLVGYFVNSVALRADVSGEQTFSELLGRTRETVLDALAHQDYPFPLLVERLQPHRDPSYSPVFQAMFVLESTPRPEDQNLALLALGDPSARVEVGGLPFEPFALKQQISQFDLTLRVAEGADGLAVQLEYSTDLFEPETAARLLSHFRQLLSAACSARSLPLSRLPLSPPEELRRLTAPAPLDWPADWPPRPAACLHHLFEAQARRAPDAVALAR